jgi:hypothetical protein
VGAIFCALDENGNIAVAERDGDQRIGTMPVEQALTWLAEKLGRAWEDFEEDASKVGGFGDESGTVPPSGERSSKSGDAGQTPDGAVQSIKASEVSIVAVRWLWPDRFVMGKLNLLAGLPDEGKGQISCDATARVTRGSEWPNAEGRAPKGSVIILQAEDGLADTVVPRLMSAGADLDKVHIIQAVATGGTKRIFSLATDLVPLRRLVAEIGDVKLIIIDPVT